MKLLEFLCEESITRELLLEHISRPVYLHFLDRELLTCVGAYDTLSASVVYEDLRFILFATYEPAYLSISLVLENKFARMIFEQLSLLFQMGHIETALRADSLRDEVLLKRGEYSHATEGYLFYFDDTWKKIADIGPIYLHKQRDTSIVLEDVIVSDLQAHGAINSAKRLGINAEQREIARLTPYVAEALRERKGHAVTRLLFVKPYRELRASFATKKCFDIKVSEHYVKAYISEYDGTIATGLSSGVEYFSYLCPTFPFHHIPLWREVNRRLGCLSTVRTMTDENIVTVRESIEFQNFVDEVRLFIARAIRARYLAGFGPFSHDVGITEYLKRAIRAHLKGNSGTPHGVDEYLRVVEQATTWLRLTRLDEGWLDRLPKSQQKRIFRKNTHERASKIKEVRTLPIKIFISHSSEDVELVKLILRAMEDSLHIPNGSIRCTSVPGYKLLTGTHTSTTLRKELTECELIIGVLTRNSLVSGYVLFELGAGWGMAKWTVALLGGDVDFSDIPGPLIETNAIRINERSSVFQFIDDIALQLQLERRPTSKSVEAIDNLVSFS